MMPKVTIGLGDQVHEEMEPHQNTNKPHNSHTAKRVQQFATRRFHMIAAVADEFQIGTALLQLANEICAVQIAARFTRTKKNTHGVRAYGIVELRNMRKGTCDIYYARLKLSVYRNPRRNPKRKRGMVLPPSLTLSGSIRMYREADSKVCRLPFFAEKGKIDCDYLAAGDSPGISVRSAVLR